MGRAIPDRWLSYTPIGKEIPNTRIFACKVPLKMNVNVKNDIPEDQQLYPEILIEKVPKLGLIIDLTDTNRYYQPEAFTSAGVKHVKLNIPGHVLPPKDKIYKFISVIDEFLSNNSDNDKLIAVHCTHGVNRTGLMVCSYLVQYCKMKPDDAISSFGEARGHDMERENYKEFVHKIDITQCFIPNISKDLGNSKGSQSSDGFWITPEQIAKSKRRNDERTMGIVKVAEQNLIPDGNGGYFLHVTRNDIELIRGNDSGYGGNYGANNYYSNNYQSYHNNSRNYDNNDSRNGYNWRQPNSWRADNNDYSNGSRSWHSNDYSNSRYYNNNGSYHNNDPQGSYHNNDPQDSLNVNINKRNSSSSITQGNHKQIKLDN